MKQPRVSVIVPTFNRVHYLGTACESVFGQTFRDFELIVVDDGSTDGTREWLDRVGDRRLQPVFQENRGISAAMNAGIRAARGEYIARLDSDDAWLPEMLASGVEILDARPEVGLVYSRAQQMDQDGHLQPVFRGNAPWFPGETLKSMLYSDFTCNIAIVARRECFEKIGLYDESLRTSEDWDIWLRVARHYEFAFVDRVLARFRIHGGNTTHHSMEAFADYLEGRPRVLEKFFGQADLPPRVAAMSPMAFEHVFTGVGLCWLQARQFRKALAGFWRAVRVSGKPLLTGMRILWQVLVWEWLSKWAPGRRLVEWQANLFFRWRQRRQTRTSQSG